MTPAPGRPLRKAAASRNTPGRLGTPNTPGARETANTPPSAAGAGEARIRAIYERLRRRYGPLDPPPKRDPLEEVVFTVLSQNTSDVNRDRAFASLRARFPTWSDVAEARPADVAAAIKVGGLSNIKAPRIQAILREVLDRESRLDLSWMRRASTPRVERYLMSLPGVGPKTAACVVAFSLGRARLPVDTHVHRVAGRLGLIPAGVGAGPAHDLLHTAVPARIQVRMHVGLIRLGRDVCRAGRPRCEDCALVDLCPTAPLVLGSGPQP